jgi:UDP-N-acetylglucosamine 4-epimerase
MRGDLAARAVYRPLRDGDVQHSLADINLARKLLGYAPSHEVTSGLRETLSWYVSRLAGTPSALA